MADDVLVSQVEDAEQQVEDLAGGLLAVVAHNQRSPDLTRLYTVLAAESVAPEHLGHEHFQDRYRTVRTALAHAVQQAQEAGELSDDIDAVNLATLLVAVMDGLQLQFLLDPESVDMVEPLAQLFRLLGANA